MAATSKTTTDHQKIMRWTEERGGHPATVKHTAGGAEPGVLRIDFPGYSGQESLEEISWDEFFDKFEENKLAFLYQDKTKEGQLSRFSKLVSRTGQDSGTPRAARGGKTAVAGSSARAGKKSPAKISAKSGAKSSATNSAKSGAKKRAGR
jgi:hypothetical protein